MNKPTHVMGGITAGIAVNKFVVPTLTNVASIEGVIGIVAVMAGAFLGSVLPDIDHRGSFIGRRLRIISTPFAIAGFASKQVKKVANTVTGKKGSTDTIISHRGITHTLIFAIGLCTLLSYLVLQLSGFSQAIMLFFVLGLFGGILSHLVLDMLTKSGVPLLYPFTKRDFSFAPFETGGVGEYIASFGCIALIVLMLQDSPGILMTFIE